MPDEKRHKVTNPTSNLVPPLAKPLTMPRCPGCGYTVEKAGDVCEACAEKPQFQAPKATREMTPQPEPAYLRDSIHFSRNQTPTTSED